MEYASNTAVSMPVKLTNVEPHVDFNGIMWNNMIGFMFNPPATLVPLRPPSQVWPT